MKCICEPTIQNNPNSQDHPLDLDPLPCDTNIPSPTECDIDEMELAQRLPKHTDEPSPKPLYLPHERRIRRSRCYETQDMQWRSEKWRTGALCQLLSLNQGAPQFQFLQSCSRKEKSRIHCSVSMDHCVASDGPLLRLHINRPNRT